MTSFGVFRKGDLKSRNRPPFVAGMIVSALTLFISFSIAIAAWTNVPEVTRAPGEITPTDDFRQIEAPEIGTVVAVNAREGDLVAEGQVLAALSSPELIRQIRSLETELETLQNRIVNHAFILGGLDGNTAVSLGATNDLDYAIAALNTLRAQRTADRDAIERLNVEMAAKRTALARLTERQSERVEELTVARNLFERGLSTQTQVTASKSALSSVDDQIHALELSILANQKDIATLQAKVEQDALALRQKHVEEKFDAEQQLSVKQAELQTLQQRAAALQVVAPTDGRIHSVGFPNKGEVIERGETLFELLPTGEALVAVLRIPTRDIGHITTGMTVKLRLETFDARTVLPLEGTIISVSPNRVFDRDLGEDYFRATVELDRESASFNALQDRLSAGMVVTAEVVTRERSMLAYILKPIERSVSLAFGER
ncbi:MAG: HlyD family type I secretion periplasmic adaptor subunit [Pseudomonadota bacterium]